MMDILCAPYYIVQHTLHRLLIIVKHFPIRIGCGVSANPDHVIQNSLERDPCISHIWHIICMSAITESHKIPSSLKDNA